MLTIVIYKLIILTFRDGVAAKNESPIFPNFLTYMAEMLAITGKLLSSGYFYPIKLSTFLTVFRYFYYKM